MAGTFRPRMEDSIPSINDYQVGWICAISVEYVIACEMLDQEYSAPYGIPFNDDNSYTFGRMGDHSVVMACLPAGKYGLTSAASVARDMLRTFPSIRFGLMVGIGGGAPSKKHDIRLGDVVVSSPGPNHGGVIQYDYGKTVQNKKFRRTDSPIVPPAILLSAIQTVKQRHTRKGNQIDQTVDHIVNANPRLSDEYRRPDSGTDVLFETSFVHSDDAKSCRDLCDHEHERIVYRRERDHSRNDKVVVHYGLIASANQLMKDATTRDYLAESENALCFEMEAAGLVDRFNCVVVRGICDYSDTHKNDVWQGYAAAVAAAYAKELLLAVNASSQQYKTANNHDQTQIDWSMSQLTFKSDGTSTRSATIVASPPPDANEMKREFSSDELACLSSLWFKDMYNRRQNIDRASDGTCLWLESHKTYQKWMEAGFGLLQIKGKPGAGKSVLLDTMVRLIESRKSSIEFAAASFFIDGRGFPLQKTAVGLYRSLLHQLLSQCPPLLADFCERYRNNLGSRSPSESIREWHEKELFEYLNTRVREYSSQYPMKIFIDALDELGESLARKLARDFWTLSTDHPFVEGRLSICFSCRHYPDLDFKGILEICVEDQNTNDILKYVQTAVKPVFSDPAQRATLEMDIVRQASGLFLWVALNVPRVVELGRDGHNFEKIRTAIKQMPKDLWLVYEEAFSMIRDSDKGQSLRLMQWLCAARRPLSIPELRYAVSFDPEPRQKSLAAWTSSPSYIASDEQMIKQIKVVSAGLLEITRRPVPEVRFIHQSVKDYFLGEGLSELEQFVGQKQDQDDNELALGRAHNCISRCCLHYIFSDEIRKASIVSRALLRRQHPLFDYAVTQWVFHSKAAEEHGIQQENVMQDFEWPSDKLVTYWLDLGPKVTTQSAPFVPMVPPTNSTVLHVTSFYGISTAIDTIFPRKPPQGWFRFRQVRTEDHSHHLEAKDSAGYTPLIWAARNGHRATVRRLLEAGAHHYAVDSANRSPLFWASYNGHTDVCEILLNHGADPDYADWIGRTPLAWASRRGHVDTVKLLLTMKADPNKCDVDGFSPLAAAADRLYLGICDLLLQHGARAEFKQGGLPFPEWIASIRNNVSDQALSRFENKVPDDEMRLRLLFEAIEEDKPDEVRSMLGATGFDPNKTSHHGFTLLKRALRSESISVIEMLIQEGADVESDHRELLFQAAKYGSLSLMTYLTDRFSPDPQDHDRRTPLHIAIQYRHVDIVELLIACHAHLDHMDAHGNSPLSVAAEKGDPRTLELLVKNRVEVDAQDASSQTPLFHATIHGHSYIVDQLLNAGADPNHSDVKQLTPLYWAIQRRRSEIVATLLRHGVKTDILCDAQNLPLTLAVKVRSREIVELLLQAKVDMEQCDGTGRSPLSWAAQLGDESVFESLFWRGATINSHDGKGMTPLAFAAMHGRKSILAKLLSKGAKIEEKDCVGNTPLWHAILGHHLETVRFLLENGADPDIPSATGRTLFQYASDTEDSALMSLLLPLMTERDRNRPSNTSFAKLYAQANRRDAKGCTPLWWATKNGSFDIMKLLLDRGHADPNIPSNSGSFPISEAVKRGRLPEAELLLTHGASCKPEPDQDLKLLSFAAENNDQAMIKLLLENNVDIDNVLSSGQTVLCWAAKRGYVDIVRILLERNADPEFAASYDRTPLEWALEGGHQDIVRLLIEYAMK